jgi:hypothetical protein
MPILNYPLRLHAIRMFFKRAFRVDDEYVHILDKEYTEEEWDEFGEAEHDHALDMLLDYQAIVARTVLGELNALVEYELKWVAKSIQRQHHGLSHRTETKITREKARKIIENEYHIDLNCLPGFVEVDEIRKVINAYKHNDGYCGEYEPFFFGFMEKKYELDLEMIDEYVQAVSEFLGALPGSKLNLGEDVRVK